MCCTSISFAYPNSLEPLPSQEVKENCKTLFQLGITPILIGKISSLRNRFCIDGNPLFLKLKQISFSLAFIAVGVLTIIEAIVRLALSLIMKLFCMDHITIGSSILAFDRGLVAMRVALFDNFKNKTTIDLRTDHPDGLLILPNCCKKAFVDHDPLSEIQKFTKDQQTSQNGISNASPHKPKGYTSCNLSVATEPFPNSSFNSIEFNMGQ